MSTIHDVLRGLLLLPGATYSCVADRVSGDLVAEAGEEPGDPAVVVRWARAAADFLAAADDDLDDLMITSRWSYRLVRLVDDGDRGPLLLHLCLDRSRANLAVARRELSRVRLDAAEAVPRPRGSALSTGETVSLAGSPGRSPLPRRVPASIPPPAPRTPPTRTPRALASYRSASSAARSSTVARSPVTAAPPEPDPDGAEGDMALRIPAVSATGWSDDVGTLRRLLDGLRALR